jgi:hypothetical protein
VTHTGERIGAYRALVGRLDGNRTLRRSSRKWDDNIKLDLQEVGCGYELDCSFSGQEQVLGCYECGNELSGSIKCGEYIY